MTRALQSPFRWKLCGWICYGDEFHQFGMPSLSHAGGIFNRMSHISKTQEKQNRNRMKTRVLTKGQMRNAKRTPLQMSLNSAARLEMILPPATGRDCYGAYLCDRRSFEARQGKHERPGHPSKLRFNCRC